MNRYLRPAQSCVHARPGLWLFPPLSAVFLFFVFLSVLVATGVPATAQPAFPAAAPAPRTPLEPLFFDNFEAGDGDWFADNGLWQIGLPTATTGPDSTYDGLNSAGTVLEGDYPTSAQSRLISPPITLPSNPSDEPLILRFWHWFSFASNDQGQVQISVDGGEWEDLAPPFTGIGGSWTQFVVTDLSAYAGSSVRIGFLLIAGDPFVSSGWYIDNVAVERTQFFFQNPQDFEMGTEDWYADHGIWEIGAPTVGPEAAHGGEFVAGTVLDGLYPHTSSSRLISPEVVLTPLPDKTVRLRFWHWFSFGSNDGGVLQLSVNGGPWEDLSESFTGVSGVWSQYIVPDLTVYADSTVRFGFLLNAGDVTNGIGWYIDDLLVEGIQTGPAEPNPLEAPEPEYPEHTAEDVPLDGVFTWGASPNATAYQIQVATDVNFTAPIVSATGIVETRYTMEALSPATTYYWRVRALTDTTMSPWSAFHRFLTAPETVSVEDGALPASYRLAQNYPNPFNPTTTIAFDLPTARAVTLTVHDALGRQVDTLVDGWMPAGTHRIAWSARDLSSGLYLYRLRAGAYVETRRMTLVK